MWVWGCTLGGLLAGFLLYERCCVHSWVEELAITKLDGWTDWMGSKWFFCFGC